MSRMTLHEAHERLGARFTSVQGAPVVADYGSAEAEYRALKSRVGVADLSARSRLAISGEDRIRFLHGQVTQNIRDLEPGRCGYTAITTARGKLEADAWVCRLDQELLLDMEPGTAAAVAARLERFVIADDVQVTDLSATYGQLELAGPAATDLVRALQLPELEPAPPGQARELHDERWGPGCWIRHDRYGLPAYWLWLEAPRLADFLASAAPCLEALEGRLVGWTSLEWLRLESGVPRFPEDMDSSNLAPESGLAQRAISYSKGCYIGQEVINRIRSRGQVAKSLRRLVFLEEPARPFPRGASLVHEGRPVGYLTSAARPPGRRRTIALGYVRREIPATGTRLHLEGAEGRVPVEVCGAPFEPFTAD